MHTISGTTTQKDYCGNVVYENGVQKMLLTEEGYVDLSNNTYYYYLKDHQGNNRVVLSSSGTVAEVNHYYPFGSLFANTSVQPYKYNGKELDSKKGLNWYDYGARHYDATLGRWLVVDPLAEKRYSNSTFSYASNNPINKIDSNGMLDDWVEDKNGNIYWNENATSQTSTKEGETYLGKTVVLFDGYMDEQLGTKKVGDLGYDGKNTTGYIDGVGAKTAQVTVYGPKGENDVQQYVGFTMTSDYNRFGAIEDGVYDVTFKNPGKGGALKSNYAVNNANPVDCINGINPSPKEFNPYSKTQKNGIYIHRTNMSGWAGGSVSTGCLLISGQQWKAFTKQVGNNDFKLKLTRK